MASPHTRFCSAIAKEKVSRPQPRSSDIGRRNKPKLCRVPRASARMMPPQTSTTVGVRQPERFKAGVSLPHFHWYRATHSMRAGFPEPRDRKSTRLNSSHLVISYAVFCLKKKKDTNLNTLKVDRCER